MPQLAYPVYVASLVVEQGRHLTKNERRYLKNYLADRNPVAYRGQTFEGWSSRDLAQRVLHEADEQYAETYEDE